MKLKFRQQGFQAEAASAVCDFFKGQPRLIGTHLIDQGLNVQAATPGQDIGWNNHALVPELDSAALLANLRAIQIKNGLKPSDSLLKSPACDLNLTVEMETGTGKTYTYIKTMHELYKAYGWGKFIVVVPSIAIREGVFKTFQITEEHFAERYGEKIRFFLYNSANLAQISAFAQNDKINAMIINSQAFNARGADARRIDMRLDDFNSRRPIDVIAATRPVLIIDEPQSVEGKVTREKLARFAPLFALRYSATHRPDALYNMVYRLDAQDAYNRDLVKRIHVTGFRVSGTTATNSYLYLESVNLSSGEPTATLEYECKRKSGIVRTRSVLKEGDNLYPLSGDLEEYRDGYTISRLDGAGNFIEFLNGKKLVAGEVTGHVDEDRLRRLQIRETILAHFRREAANFARGVKTLSLFFIDEVAKYRQYDAVGEKVNGLYAKMFEEEYAIAVEEELAKLGNGPQEWLKWLKTRPASEAHSGYFSIDKKGGKYIDSKLKRGEAESADVDAYDLIMKDRERLLDPAEPVRFIFSHSALREGWDNPNVFQICALKRSGSETRKRQEVGRGLRLCVNSAGERMDSESLGALAKEVNILTVIAPESYSDFANGLQRELAEGVASRPRDVAPDLFEGETLRAPDRSDLTIGKRLATLIHEDLIKNGYVAAGQLTPKYHEDREKGGLKLLEEVAPYAASVVAILDSVYQPIKTTDARSQTARAELDQNKAASGTFKKLWSEINSKTRYTVKFDENELIANSIKALNRDLHIQKIYFTVEAGKMERIASREALERGEAFQKVASDTKQVAARASGSVRYDLLGKMVEQTGLTRGTIAKILAGIAPDVFDQYKQNPEDFIIKAGAIINSQKAAIIIERIQYDKLEERYSADIFAEARQSGEPGKNAMATKKHLYNYLIYDSETERKFAEEMERDKSKVELYVKLPKSFFIPTPMGNYNPDWAIAFYEGEVKHIYFVAETKGSADSLELRAIEEGKISCARKHFEEISSKAVKYDVVSNYQDLLNRIMK